MSKTKHDPISYFLNLFVTCYIAEKIRLAVLRGKASPDGSRRCKPIYFMTKSLILNFFQALLICEQLFIQARKAGATARPFFEEVRRFGLNMDLKELLGGSGELESGPPGGQSGARRRLPKMMSFREHLGWGF